ncbi:hypothetical protein OG800_43025 [Streptomyces sp. NBC_00445]|uniref:hypothetical protein n=1 Tax=Streptomyces sp. NBC_00445 TaxID=2975745 RepID=UPI002E1DB8CD
MQRFFFAESRSFGYRVNQLFDFIQPASVALWNLRWQVQGYVSAVPGATDTELAGRFSHGAGVRANNLKGVCIDTPWEDQLGQFAQIVGANMIALYEGWAEGLLPKFGNPKRATDVQFPTKGKYGQNTRKGVGNALAEVHSSGISTEMQKAFFPTYSASKKYSLAHLDALAALYRYHKEVRNSFMHSGGLASDRAAAAWLEVSRLTKADIGGKSDPILTKIVEGDPITYRIEEAIQLADVIIRLVHTVDSELMYTSYAENHFMELWKGTPGVVRLRALPGDPRKRKLRVDQICKALGFLAPNDPEAVVKLGKNASLLDFA